jgi:sialate O-acetylesterase
VHGKELEGFSIAGKDRKFVWANSRIEGNTVVVSSPRIPKPVSVRYAWADNPACNLFNSSDLPASPFRTDNWLGITK